MTPIQTACLFATGFFVSRFVLRAGVHEVFVDWLVLRADGRVSRVVLAVMFLAFALSTVVPNALTVLALLPVIARLRSGAEDTEPRSPVGTLLVMGLIYGANIGGVGSLLGSPANLYLLVNLELYNVPGREHLHFVSWLVFGFPMAVTLVLMSWGVMWLLSPGTMACRLSAATYEPTLRPPLYHHARRWALAWAVGWMLLLVTTLMLGLRRAPGDPITMHVATFTLPGRELAVDLLDLVALGLSLVYTLLAFGWPLRTPDGPTRLLRLRDLVRDLPLRGLAIAAAVLLLLVLVARSGAVSWLQTTVPALLPQTHRPFVAALVLVLVTIFCTELLNNTTVATVMFPVTAASAGSFGADPLLVMLGVSLASTCAFMTPVATPVNALALASVRGVSLRRFLWTGLWVNLIAALWIALWITWLVPPILRLFHR